METYLLKVTRLVQDLRTWGVTVSDSEIILYAIGGLDFDFESIVAVISSRLATMTIQTMQVLLINQKIRNAKVRGMSQSFSSVNIAKSYRKEQVSCQICSKKRQIAIACHNRHNEDLYPTPLEHRAKQLSIGKRATGYSTLAKINALWNPDSGAEGHVSGNGKFIQFAKPLLKLSGITVANGTIIPASKVGAM